jgi:nicotinate phosphoribosyltransferase
MDPAWFNLPVDRFREGGSIDRSAARVREILLAEGRAPRVTVQISAERGCIMGGTDEAIALLKLCLADDWSALSVSALSDGDRAEAGETVMTVCGPYSLFAHLEPLLVGTLARRTRVTTNARAFVEAARPKIIMAFPARHDHWLLEPGDALGAQIGGALTISADPPVPPTGVRVPPAAVVPALALMPHALIAVYGGDTLAAANVFVAHVGSEGQVVVPVDYENDAVRTALEVARAIDLRLWGVQLGTSENLVDASIIPTMGAFPPTGVNPQLVWNVRNALDAEGLGDVKILASSGVTIERIRQFEDEGVPVDAYGIGAALLAGRTGFLAALVEMDAPLRVRAGSEPRPSTRLERVK